MISLPIDLTAALLKDVQDIKHLISFEFTSRTARYTDCDQALYYDGEWYDPHPVKFSPVQGGVTSEAMTSEITLSNIDKTFSDLVLAEDIRDKPCQIYRVLLTKNLAIIGTPLLIFPGYVDTVHIDRQDARISVADELIKWKTQIPRRMHDEHCQWKDFQGIECRYGWKVLNADFETWTTATNCTDWTETLGGSSTINRDGHVKYSGHYSARIDVNGGAAYLGQAVTLVGGNTYKLILRHRESVNNKIPVRRFDLRTSDGVHYLKEDGTWNAGAYYPKYKRSTNWQTVEISFTAIADHTDYLFYPYADNTDDNGHSIWIDEALIIETENTWCDRSKDRCKALSNYLNFGGFGHVVELQDKEIWWGRLQKSFVNFWRWSASRG